MVAMVRTALALLLALSAVAAQKQVNLAFTSILRSNAKVGKFPLAFGQVLNENMKPVFQVDADNVKTKDLLVSNEPDFSSLIEVKGTDGKPKIFLVTHFESPRPGTQYVVELTQQTNGTLTPKSMQFVDWSSLHGIWIPCAGVRSPWMTHLGSEEYEPDARPFSEATDLDSLKALSRGGWSDIEGFMRFFNLYPKQLTFDNVVEKFNPYRYGHITETEVNPDGSADVQKWYTLGRASWELSIVMPDLKTVYATDDGSNVAFFKFVADVAGDLSSGRLYAARFTQTNGQGGGAFRMNWVHLGHGQNDDLMDLAETTTFGDIFETADFSTVNNRCPAGFKSINQKDVGVECLKLKPGMAKAAAFLETRRYAAMKGATTEFSKWEGITFDPKRNVLYTAMSAIRNGMEDNKAKGKASTKFDIGGPNHIKLAYNTCGCVYRIMLNAKFNAYQMASMVCGKLNTNKTDVLNECSLESIASPDNVNFIPELDTLLIAEDTESHENDLMWAYNVRTGDMKRVLTTQYGAEVTSPYFYPNIGGYSYILAVSQHPYEGRDDKMSGPGYIGADATVGYYHWKASDMKGASSAMWTGINPSLTEAEKHSIRGTNKVTFFGRRKKA